MVVDEGRHSFVELNWNLLQVIVYPTYHSNHTTMFTLETKKRILSYIETTDMKLFYTNSMIQFIVELKAYRHRK